MMKNPTGSNVEGDVANKLALPGRDEDKRNENDQTQGTTTAEQLQEFAQEAMVEARAISQVDRDEWLKRKLTSINTNAVVPVAPLGHFKQFAEEAKEEDRTTLDNHEEYLEKKLQPTTMNDIVANGMPADSTKRAPMMAGNDTETTTQSKATPGAIAIMGTRGPLMGQSHQLASAFDVNDYTAPGTTDTTLRHMEEQPMHYATATLVGGNEEHGSADMPVLASATKIDTEAIEQANRQRQIRAVLISVVLAIAAGGIAYAIYASTRPNAQPVTVAPSPNIFNAPNETFTLNPSASPSTMLFAFIADKSFDDGAALFLPGSPQQKAMAWIEGEYNGTLLNDEADLLQLYSLATLYYATSGSEWNQSSSNVEFSPWLVGINYCSWGGVACNAEGNMITMLDLNSRSLSGSFPAELGHLSGLEYLDLGKNNISGTLLSEIGLLTSLRDFRVYRNVFTGPLPTEIGQLTALTRLSVSFNQFTGILTTEIGRLTKLTGVYMAVNYFNDSLPTEIGLLRQLTYFDIELNMMSGKLPTELGRLTSLTELNLAANMLIGSIPSEIGLLTNLMILYAFKNKCTGSLPTEIGKLTSLKNFSIHTNQYFSGPLCTEIGLLSNLEFVSISTNEFNGTIPTEIGQLRSLTLLELLENQFSGTIPTEIGHLTILNHFDFSSNRFVGPFPTEVCKLRSLTRLNLSSNRVTGTLPSEIGFLTMLYLMYGGDNKFNGTVPTEIGNMTSLEFLRLFKNQFIGNVPTEIALLSSLKNLSLHTNNLIGTIQQEIWLLTKLQSLELSINQFEGTLPTEIGHLNDLKHLGLLSNQLGGSVPTEIGQLTSLTGLYLNDNQFSGTLPTEVGQLRNLSKADFSENSNLTGAVPVEVCNFDALLTITYCPPLVCPCTSCTISTFC